MRRLWVDEAEERFQNHQKGKTKLQNGANVLARLKAR